MNNLEFLKSEINKIDRLKKSLNGISDQMLLENETLILNAIESHNNLISGGYVIDVWINQDLVEWSYIPETKEAIEREKNFSIENLYIIPLANKKHYSITLNDVNWPETRRPLYEYTKKLISLEKIKGKGIWLQAPSGSGKSFYAKALLNKIVTEKEIKVGIVNSSFINSMAENIIRKGESSVGEAIELLVGANVLVFDSIDNSWFNKWVKENILISILDLRSQKERVTIFTSNITFDKYKDKLNFSSKDYDQEALINEKIISKIKELIESEIKI